MEVEVSDPALADDLVRFLRRARCSAERLGDDVVSVTIADPIPEEAARLEIEAYLQVWQSQHPGVRVRRRPAFDL
jgi:hypothetical protein